MPRYFIDTSDGDTFVHDDEGQDLPNVAAARDTAQATLLDMAREKMPDGEKRTFCAFVRDETGTVIYRVALSLVGEWSAGGCTSESNAQRQRGAGPTRLR